MSNKEEVGRKMINDGPMILSPGGTNLRKPSLEVPVVIATHEGQNEQQDSSKNHLIYDNDMIEESKLVRDLFGGAIHVKLPLEYEDISTVRDVPDNQEVYLDKYANISVIFELFDLDETLSGEDIVSHYFDDIALCNQAEQCRILKKEIIDSVDFLPAVRALDTNGNFLLSSLIGTQIVPKGKSNIHPSSSSAQNTSSHSLDNIFVIIFVLRMPTVMTDLSISINIPYSAQASAPAAAVYINNLSDILASTLIADMFNPNSLIPVPFEIPLEVITQETDEFRFPSYDPVAMIRQIVHSLTIRDWSLFA